MKKNIIQLASEIDEEYFNITQIIIDYAITKFKMKLMNHIYLSLTDHIAFAVKRFVVHLNAFAQRFLDNQANKEQVDFIYEQVCINCKTEYECVKKIRTYIYNEYARQLPIQEELYLMIHIHKILGELEGN